MVSRSKLYLFMIFFGLESTVEVPQLEQSKPIQQITEIDSYKPRMVMIILPKFNVYLLDKTKGIEIGESLIDKVNCEKLK